MEVKLLNFTPLWICSNAIRTCWQSFDKGDNGGEIDKELINRVGNIPLILFGILFAVIL